MRQSHPGLTALVLFFAFGALASGTSAVTLAIPGTPLDELWRLNPRGHSSLIGIGNWAVVLMVAVCVACSAAARGLVIRAAWGRWLAIGIVATNLVGDVFNAAVLGDLRTLIGIPIAAAIIAYLMRPSTKSAFSGPLDQPAV